MPENDSIHEGRDQFFVDIDRMINEGLGGGQVTIDNGLIEEVPDIGEEATPRSVTQESQPDGLI